VEPAEVEVALGRHPSVRQSVVLAREQAVGGRCLTAYVVANDAAPPTAGELRAFLRRTLPEWMVPSAFVFLPSLPLTANGKVDRAVLPVPGVESSREEREFVAPRDILELQLAQTWQDVLGVNPVGIRDNFFDLGGHSLLALRLFARIERILGTSLPLATLFQAPTVERLADVIRQRERGWSAFGSSVVPIQSRGSKPPIFALPGVGGNVLGYFDLARLLGGDQPFYGLQARGLDGREAPFTGVQAMAAHHVEEVRRVQPHGPYFLMGACLGAVVAFEMAQQLHARGERVAFLGMLDPARAGRRYVAGLLRWLTLPRFVLRRLGRHLRAAYRLDRAGRHAYIRDKVRAAREMIVQRDLFRGDRTELYQVQVAEANQHALWRYVPRAYRGSVTLFVTTGRIARSARDRRLDWTQLAEGGVEVHEISGSDSGDMLREPHVRALVDRLQACLGRARAS
jgi:thioesterase domain-containing protein/acyl carrier protein